jgi:peptidyl-dipeptidase Dcp
MIEAIFDCAKQLFNLTFILRDDIVAYHKDVKVYEVYEDFEDENKKKLIALFLHDNYARQYKQVFFFFF